VAEHDEELEKVAIELVQKLDDHLPIEATIREVVLMENVSGRWRSPSSCPACHGACVPGNGRLRGCGSAQGAGRID